MKRLLLTIMICFVLTSCSTNNNESATENQSTNDEIVDATTSPSITSDKDEFVKSLSADGNWITCITEDITLDDNLSVDGTFYKKDDEAEGVYRKLALYEQDSDKNVTASYTLTVPEMTISSENFRIQEGVVVGNIIVEANGFELKNSIIDGSITFVNDEFKNSALLDEGTVTGEIS